MAFNNSNPFSDLFKNTLDFNQLFSTLRRNTEALSEVNQVVVEGVQAVSRRQAEVARVNVENALKVSKDIFTSGTPETNLSKQADLAKAFFENSLSNLREMTEMATKLGFEAFDVLNRRAAESMEEIGSATSAASPKKKAA